MRIRIRADDRVLAGTELQIVKQMRALAFGRETESLDAYMEWVSQQYERLAGERLVVKGTTADERARSLVEELVRTGAAEVV
jgi:hypothetical protein